MKSIVIWLLVAVVFFAILFAFFRGCSGFVSEFDGENKERMVKLTGDYFYGKVDKTVWLREETTDSYRRIIPDNIDSLVWNNKIIVGYVGGKYFCVVPSSGIVSYLSGREQVVDILNQNKDGEYKFVEQVPRILF